VTRIQLTCFNAFGKTHAATLILVELNQAHFFCLLDERSRQAVGCQSAEKFYNEARGYHSNLQKKLNFVEFSIGLKGGKSVTINGKHAKGNMYGFGAILLWSAMPPLIRLVSEDIGPLIGAA